MKTEEHARRDLLSISELARFARISRTALIHYDRVGLVKPLHRGGNNYRYYSHHQVTSTNLITTLQSLGMPLKEIAEALVNRTPRNMLEMLSKQKDVIESEKKRLDRANELLETLHGIIKKGIEADENLIETKIEEEESIFLGPQIDYSKGKTIDEATLDFYKYCGKLDENMDMNYPVWGRFEGERVKQGDWIGPDRFYFRMPHAPHRKPEALYAVGYTRGNYGQSDGLYRRLMEYIEKNGLEICGPAYEAYPLNEISIVDYDSYLMKISITVRREKP